MRILVTGGAGYLGSVLVPMLLQRDHHVTVLDSFRHGVPSLLGCCADPNLVIINGDTRNFTKLRPLVETADAVIPLAALVGAAACDRDVLGAASVNFTAVQWLCTTMTAEQQLIIYPNTNSGYGIGADGPCTEDSPLKPLTSYGQTKVAAERVVLKYGGVSLRFATLFGCSPRMRLDLLVNDFVHRAVKDRSLTLFEGGFRRNYLHVRDAAAAIIFALNHPDKMSGQAYNAGDTSVNLTKRELCERIAAQVPGFVWHEAATGEDPDKRDYIISNAKLEALGWKPATELGVGIVELAGAFRALPLDTLRCRNDG